MEQKTNTGCEDARTKTQSMSTGSDQLRKSTRLMMDKLKKQNLINITTQIGMVKQLIADHFQVNCSLKEIKEIEEIKEEDYLEYLLETEKRMQHER